jgi:hypothetical protein
MDTGVLIVGAGPTGLMLANQLARRGCSAAHDIFNLLLILYHSFAVFYHNRRRTPVEPRPAFGSTLTPLQTDSEQDGAMSSAGLKHIGFIDPRRQRGRRRAVALAQLIAAVTLVLSIAVSVIVVGIARACAPVTPTVSASHSH